MNGAEHLYGGPQPPLIVLVQDEMRSKDTSWGWEMAQPLRAPTTLLEDHGSSPSTHMAAPNGLELQFHAVNILFWHRSGEPTYPQAKYPHTENNHKN